MRDLKEISARCLPHPWILRPLEALRDRPTVGLRALDHVPIGELLLTPPLPVLRNLDHLSLVRSSVSVASNANLGEQVAGPKAGPFCARLVSIIQFNENPEITLMLPSQKIKFLNVKP